MSSLCGLLYLHLTEFRFIHLVALVSLPKGTVAVESYVDKTSCVYIYLCVCVCICVAPVVCNFP